MIILMLLPILNYGQNYHSQWVHIAGYAARVTISSQAVNAAGNVYVSGNFINNNLSFDNSTTSISPDPNPAKNKIFIAKYDTGGNLIWAKGFSSGNDITAPVITIDYQNNIYLTGYFSNYITFGSLTLTQNQNQAPNYSYFIVKFDSSGQALWAKQSPSLFAQYIVNNDGHIALYGSFIKPSVTLDSNLTLINSDSSGQTMDYLIAELDKDGHFLWAKSGGVSGKSEEVDHVAFTSKGQIYVSGLFESTFTLGGITLNSTGNTSWFAKDWFLARYDANGNVPWAVRGGISLIAPIQLADGAPLIKTDQFDNLYFLGKFHQSTMQFDTLVLNGNGNLSGSVVANTVDAYWFAGKYDGKNNLRWVKSGNSPVLHIQFIPANDGGLYLTGIYRDTTIFGNITLNGIGANNQTLDCFGFVVKLDDSGQVSWVKHFGLLLRDPIIFDMVVDQHNTLAILGAYGDPKGQIPNITLHFDSLSLTPVDASRDYFLARYKDNGNMLSASNIGGPAVDGLNSGQLNLVGESDLYVSGVYSDAPLELNPLTVNAPVPNLNNYFVAKYSENGTTTEIHDAMPLHSLKVFPSPSHGEFKIISDGNIHYIRVVNSLGKVVYKQVPIIPQKCIVINLTELPRGLYFLQVTNENDKTREAKILLY